MIDILNLALPYFGLIFIGFACGKAKALPEGRLAWMNFFPALCLAAGAVLPILAKTPFEEFEQPAVCDRGPPPPTALAFTLRRRWPADGAVVAARHHHGGALRRLRQFGYMGPGLALATLGAKAAVPVAADLLLSTASCCFRWCRS